MDSELVSESESGETALELQLALALDCLAEPYQRDPKPRAHHKA